MAGGGNLAPRQPAVRATEGAKEIGVGSHSRVIIDVAEFVRRLE